jgi:hypothetical protein
MFLRSHKRELLTYVEVPVLVDSVEVLGRPWTHGLRWPSLRRTQLEGNLPYNQPPYVQCGSLHERLHPLTRAVNLSGWVPFLILDLQRVYNSIVWYAHYPNGYSSSHRRHIHVSMQSRSCSPSAATPILYPNLGVFLSTCQVAQCFSFKVPLNHTVSISQNQNQSSSPHQLRTPQNWHLLSYLLTPKMPEINWSAH